MTTPLAILGGLNYKGTDLQAYPRIFFEITAGGPSASPEVRGANSRTPYKSGQTYGPKRADRLPIVIQGRVAGDGATEADQRADTAAARQEMFDLFDVTGGVGTLLLTTEDGTAWTIDAYPELFLPEAEPDNPIEWGCSVRLIAIDPPAWAVV